jgi:hypothetical protein
MWPWWPTARKLIVIALLMLKGREPYRYSLSEPTKTKLAAFRIAATGERRKKGALLAPMHSRAPGERVRNTPSLAVVYDSEGLPAMTPSEKLSAGERSVLKATNLESLLDQLQAVRCGHRGCPIEHSDSKTSAFYFENKIFADDGEAD